MNEQTIRDAFHYGASNAEPSAALWARIENEIQTRPRYSVWRKIALACASLALSFTLLMVASPAARATFDRIVSTVWSGKLGSVSTQVLGVDSKATYQEMVEAGVASSDAVDQYNFASIDAAAAKAGFSPLQAQDPRAKLEGVSVFVNAHEASDRQGGVIHVRYSVDGKIYTVISMTSLHKRGDTWEPAEFTRFTLPILSKSAVSATPVKVGDREAVCAEGDIQNAGTQTICTWTEKSIQAIVLGPDPKLTLEIAQSVVAK